MNNYLDENGIRHLWSKIVGKCNNVGYKYIESNTVNVSSSWVHLDPNKHYILTTSQSSLSITLADPVDESIANHYFLEFDYMGGSVSFPSNLLWLNGEIPELVVGYRYQLSIVNNNAILKGWNNLDNFIKVVMPGGYDSLFNVDSPIIDYINSASINGEDCTIVDGHISNPPSDDYTIIVSFNSGYTSLNSMFLATNVKEINLSNFNTRGVTDMSNMFGSCYRLTSLDVSGFDTSKVTDMSNMFYGCYGLTSPDVSGFDTSKVTNMKSMFSNCSGLTSLDLSGRGWNTSSVTNMSSMFYGCLRLTFLDLSGFDTSKVTNMSSMFYNCYVLTSLDLSGFDTSKVTNMSSMFYNCPGLTSLDLSGWNTGSVTSMNYMFSNCYELTSLIMASQLNSTLTVASMFNSITTSGTFYYNDTYDYSKIINALPSTWVAKSIYQYTSCSSLSIVAEDVIYTDTTTTINYTAEVSGTNILTGESISNTIMKTATSSSFSQNNTGADVTRTATFTYLNKTATDTFTHFGKYRTVNLNSQWRSSSKTNPDSTIFDIYESYSNYNVNSGVAYMYITISGLEKFEFYIRSYAESSYDYVMVSDLDATITGSTSTTSTLVKSHTSANQQSGTALSNYTKVKFTNIDKKKHVITILYRKDSSVNSDDDRGYILVPKDMEYSSTSEISFTWYHNKSGYILGTGQYRAVEGMTWQEWANSEYFNDVDNYIDYTSSYRDHYYYEYIGHPGIRVDASSWYVFYLSDQSPTDVIQDGKAYTSSVY